MTVTEIKSLVQFNDLINGTKPIVIDFWAAWCGPCRQISPIFEKLSGGNDQVDFYKVDVDALPDVSQAAGIRAMPTFQLYQGGAKVGELVGANPSGLETLLAKAA